jgi:ornithine carbamoyltransferase
MSARAPPTDVLSIRDIAEELPGLLTRAARLKAERARGVLRPTLPGQNLAMIFEKPSTRTRTSFEVAMHELGGHALYMSPRDLQLGRGETIADTARVLSRYVNVVAYRAFRHTDMVELARWATVPVINALDDLEHPCQIVADLLTMQERWKGKFRGHRLAWIGDGNNVLHSLLLGSAAVGLNLTVATPPHYDPRPDVVEAARELAAHTGTELTFTHDPREAARGADALYTDVWVSMGDEAEQAARLSAFHEFQVNDALVALAAPSAFVLHDLPAHRGEEITDSVLDGPRAAVWDQAENRLHVQKAILEVVSAPRRASRPRRR